MPFARGDVRHTDGSDHDEQRLSSDREQRKTTTNSASGDQKRGNARLANAARIRWTMNDDTQGTDFRVSRVSRRTSAEDTRIPTRRVEEGEGNRHQYVRSSGEPKENAQQQWRNDKKKRKSKANSRQEKSIANSRQKKNKKTCAKPKAKHGESNEAHPGSPHPPQGQRGTHQEYIENEKRKFSY